MSGWVATRMIAMELVDKTVNQTMTSKITICMGSSCFSRGNSVNLDILESYIAEHGLDVSVELAGSRCLGTCAAGPMLTIDGETFSQVDSGVLMDILQKRFQIQPKVK